jgi:hypothetical protein
MVASSSLLVRGAFQRVLVRAAKAWVASTRRTIGTRIGSAATSNRSHNIAPANATATAYANQRTTFAQHRLFSTAQVEVETLNPLVSKEDIHKEETKRGRLSDVSLSCFILSHLKYWQSRKDKDKDVPLIDS